MGINKLYKSVASIGSIILAAGALAYILKPDYSKAKNNHEPVPITTKAQITAQPKPLMLENIRQPDGRLYSPPNDANLTPLQLKQRKDMHEIIYKILKYDGEKCSDHVKKLLAGFADKYNKEDVDGILPSFITALEYLADWKGLRGNGDGKINGNEIQNMVNLANNGSFSCLDDFVDNLENVRRKDGRF